jgi:hydroxymethylpyrimidine/phosphomethylpyrimidine kinase
MKITGDGEARQAARMIVGMGARSVVVKGGHREGHQATDLFYDGSRFQEFTAPRIETTSTHGTGCTFASAVAAGLARRMSLLDAVAQAKEYVTEAIRHAFPIGQGHGPLNHFYKLWG